MPSRHHFVEVARRLKRRLEGKAYEAMPRMEITNLLREVSGEDHTRIKSNIASDLERAMLEHGVRVFPSLAKANTDEWVRIFHTLNARGDAPTILGQVVDVLAHPSAETDKRLSNLLTKIKG